jgi:RNA polymerase sigma-70 factor, ECF subfamily
LIEAEDFCDKSSATMTSVVQQEPVTAMATAVATGQGHWPTLQCDTQSFEQVATLWQSRTGLSLEQANIRDIYIAAAIVAGDKKAYSAFDSAYLQRTRPSLVKMSLSNSAIDDVFQLVREKLLVGDMGQLPKLATLVGQGNLEALVRVIVVRTGLNFRRDQKIDVQHSEDDTVLDRIVNERPGSSPHTKLAHMQARMLVRKLVGDALRDLEPRDRTILRLHFFHRMSIDELGNLYEVHRATAARWIAKICDQVQQRIRMALEQDPNQRADDMEHFLDLLRSNMSSGFAGISSALADPVGQAH